MKLILKGVVTQEDAELAVAEFEMVMRQAGTTTIKRITRDYIVPVGAAANWQ